MLLTPEQHQNICICVGQIAVPFAILEGSLDSGIAIIFADAHGNTVEKELPQKLTRKLQFVSRCLKKLDNLSSFKVEGDFSLTPLKPKPP